MNHNVKNIIYLSLFLVSLKWLFIWYLNINSNVVSAIINNIQDWQYFTLIYNLSEFNFSPVYDDDLKGSNYLTFPIYSILFHSIAFKFFNIYGFILIEFLAIFIFFYLIHIIFNEIGLNFNQSIFFGLLIICLPYVIQFLNLHQVQYLPAIKELYNSRIPRPLISNLYLFFFIYLLLTIKNYDQFDNKKIAIVGSLFAFMWGSFYINFIISGLILIFYYFLIFEKKKNFIKVIFKDAFLLFIFFSIFSIPIVYLVFINGEPDYARRVGLISLDLEKKEILLKHFISKLINIKFLLIFTLITIFFYNLKKKKNYNQLNIKLLYIVFLSSFLSPLIFTILSPKISEIYHFPNMTVSLSFFILGIYIFLTLNLLEYYLTFQKIIINILIVFFISFYSYSTFIEIKKNSMKISSLHAVELINFITNNYFDKKKSILTFDGKVQSSLILNNFKNLIIVDGINTSHNDEIIENKIIDVFHYFKLNQKDFNEFIQNKKTSWRYINTFIGKTFYMKYQANSLTTYKNSIDFSNEEMKFILKSSPLYSQQLIIPQFEINRLNEKFLNNKSQNKLNPQIIILNNNDFFSKRIKINKNLFCHKIINKTYEIYYNKSLNKECLI